MIFLRERFRFTGVVNLFCSGRPEGPQYAMGLMPPQIGLDKRIREQFRVSAGKPQRQIDPRTKLRKDFCFYPCIRHKKVCMSVHDAHLIGSCHVDRAVDSEAGGIYTIIRIGKDTPLHVHAQQR